VAARVAVVVAVEARRVDGVGLGDARRVGRGPGGLVLGVADRQEHVLDLGLAHDLRERRPELVQS